MANENIKAKDEGVKERCQYELYLEKYYGLSESVNPEMKIHTNYSDLVNMLAMYDSENKKVVDREEGWIACSEKLPECEKVNEIIETSREVQFYDEKHGVQQGWLKRFLKDSEDKLFPEQKKGYWMFENAQYKFYHVTHWQPLPSPPNNK